jgi:two-component system sensor histidine kinase QseC
MNRRLLAGVLGAVAAIWLATALVSYRDARREIDELLDAHLAQAASLLVAQAGHELEEIETEHAPELHRYGQRVAFQIWERGRVLRLHSADAPNTLLSGSLDGFSAVERDGRPWRVFSSWTQGRRFLIQVGEERAARDRVAAAIGMNLTMPMLLALPLLGLLIWLAIRWGMRPLAALGAQIAQRDPHNLAPLEVAAPSAELAPLIASLNRLLERVRGSIEGERRFTADAAHELRTPIAAVRAQAEVARAATAADERRTALDKILAGCDRAARAVEQLLTLARLDPESRGGDHEPCDLREVARAVLAEMAPTALGNRIEVELAEGPSVGVRGNPGLLTILIHNLVDNAARHSPPGGVVRVEATRTGPIARLVVSDQGPGIAPADRPKLGQRFLRLPRARGEGSGLGLSIVKRIAELHEARVDFTDAPGERGLSVVVELAADWPATPRVRD